MRDIVFLDRSELTELFLAMSKHLRSCANVTHIAYSDLEGQLLRSDLAPNVLIVNFSEQIRETLSIDPPGNLDLSVLDGLILGQSEGRFNLNSALQSDRALSLLSYKSALRVAMAYYTFWSVFFQKHRNCLIVHEPTSLLFNYICAICAKASGSAYVTQSMVPGPPGRYYYLNLLNDDYSAPELGWHLERYKRGDTVDIRSVEEFLVEFRSSFGVYLGHMIPQKSIAVLAFSAGREVVGRLRRSYKKYPDEAVVERWIGKQANAARKFYNRITYSTLQYDTVQQDDVYYYYPMHLEPEAAVLYLGDGIYQNQVKLIQNIAAQLPPNVFLYVKDHPHEFGYRASADYLKLKEVLNIKLLDPRIPGKTVIAGARGVITINGTAGLEALFMNKQVYTFGRTFYGISERVKYIHNIRDLREVVYRDFDVVYKDDTHLVQFVAAYLDAIHEGVVDYFGNRATKYGVDLEKNAKRMAEDLMRFSENYDEHRIYR